MRGIKARHTRQFARETLHTVVGSDPFPDNNTGATYYGTAYGPAWRRYYRKLKRARSHAN